MRDPYGRSNPARIIIVIVVLVMLGALGYFGWHRLMQWHEKEVDSAVEKEREKLESRQTETRKEVIEWLEKNVDRQKPEKISEKRLEDVFGKPVFKESQQECDRLEMRIRSFFDYLDRKRGLGSEEKSSYEVFSAMMDDLAENPPLVSGEVRNLSNLFNNRAHFFRVLGKERIEMVLSVLDAESDVLEHAMSNFYKYYVSEKCCELHFRSCIPEKTLYEYAAFFLDTLSGRSYLMRRDSSIRTLTRYYSVLVLDRAIQRGINQHGIDIRPHIEDALSDVRAIGSRLRFNRRYVEKLKQLRKKYGS